MGVKRCISSLTELDMTCCADKHYSELTYGKPREWPDILLGMLSLSLAGQYKENNPVTTSIDKVCDPGTLPDNSEKFPHSCDRF